MAASLTLPSVFPMVTIFTLVHRVATMHLCPARKSALMPISKVAASAVEKKSLRERALHALLFEIIGVLVFAPGLAWVLGQSLGKMGAMTVMISTVAMLWNM